MGVLKKMEEVIRNNVIKQCISREKIKIVDSTRVENAEKEIELLFKNDAFIVFAVKDNAWNQWSLKKEEINDAFLNNLLSLNNDTYMAINSFTTPKRLTSNIYSINALWSDIDYYKVDRYKNKSYEEMIEIISRNKIIKKSPPSFWMYSGKGVYAFWLLENAHGKICLPIWNTMMGEIQKELAKYGADNKSTDGAHVLRLAGSINSKTGNIAKINNLNNNFEYKRYTIKELSSKLLPELKYTKEEWEEREKEKWINMKEEKLNKENQKRKISKAKKKGNKIRCLLTVSTLNYERMNDIYSLINLRDGKCEHNRELMLFLYRYWGNCYYRDKDKALNEIIEINNMFENPLDLKEVISATKKAEDAAEKWEEKINEYYSLEIKPSIKVFFKNSGAYAYSNNKLIELLNITYEEMMAKDSNGEYILKTMISKKVKNDRSKNYRVKWKSKNRRNENGLTSREQTKIDRIYKILELKEKGYKQIEIAEQLNISKSTVSEYVKKIRENNITLESFKVKKGKKNKNNVIALDVNLDKDEKMIL